MRLFRSALLAGALFSCTAAGALPDPWPCARVFQAEFPGITVRPDPHVDPENAREILAEIAVRLREFPGVGKHLTTIDFHDRRAPYRNTWAWATGGRRPRGRYHLHFRPDAWRERRTDGPDVACHEFGHLVEFRLRVTAPDALRAYRRVHPCRNAPTAYGRSDQEECFAETFMLLYHPDGIAPAYSRDLDSLLAPHRR